MCCGAPGTCGTPSPSTEPVSSNAVGAADPANGNAKYTLSLFVAGSFEIWLVMSTRGTPASSSIVVRIQSTPGACTSTSSTSPSAVASARSTTALLATSREVNSDMSPVTRLDRWLTCGAVP
jgi:hypothetical protein